jgi:hypothetical protein
MDYGTINITEIPTLKVMLRIGKNILFIVINHYSNQKALETI